MKPPKRLLIVDGYNVLNAREHMDSLSDARERLIHELQDYAGYTDQKIILVFDAWLGDRKSRSVEDYGRVTVVFTRKGETADHFIEHTCDRYAEDVSLRRVEIRVATSDGLEQTNIFGRGATRLSSRELLSEMNRVRTQGAKRPPVVHAKATIGERIPEQVLQKLLKIGKSEDGNEQA